MEGSTAIAASQQGSDAVTLPINSGRSAPPVTDRCYKGCGMPGNNLGRRRCGLEKERSSSWRATPCVAAPHSQCRGWPERADDWSARVKRRRQGGVDYLEHSGSSIKYDEYYLVVYNSPRYRIYRPRERTLHNDHRQSDHSKHVSHLGYTSYFWQLMRTSPILCVVSAMPAASAWWI